jgi:hypothetical protein
MTTPEDIRAHRVARLERIANAGEVMLARLSHLSQCNSDTAAVAALGLVWHKITRDIEIATLLQMRIENGLAERAEPESHRDPQAVAVRTPEASAPAPRLADLRLPQIPEDFEGQAAQDLADAEVLVAASSHDDPYVRPNLDRIIARARHDRREAHVRILLARRDGPTPQPDTS